MKNPLENAVSIVRKYVDYPYTSPDTIVLDSDLVCITADHLASVVQLTDAQAARIEKLETQLATARNDALKEAAAVCVGDEDRPAHISMAKLLRMSDAEQFSHEVKRLAWKDYDEILALMTKDTQ